MICTGLKLKVSCNLGKRSSLIGWADKERSGTGDETHPLRLRYTTEELYWIRVFSLLGYSEPRCSWALGMDKEAARDERANIKC